MTVKNNKGFSLLEMIVAVSIASIVGIAVFGLMAMGAQFFTKTSSDVNVQHEAQLVFNQIQELVVDTNVGVDYDTTTVGGNELRTLTMFNYNPDDPEDPDKHVYEVQWNKESEEVYYSEYVPHVENDDASGETTVTPGTPVFVNQLMGENIKDFNADLSDLEKRRVVRLNMVTEKRGTEYKSSYNITLRNEVITGGTIPEYMEGTTPTVDPEKVVGAENVYAEPGQVIDLQGVGDYKVKGAGGNDYPDQDIRFFMADSPAYDAGTSVSTSGTLTVSKAQKSDFSVVVSTRTGKGAPLLVKVNMIVVDSVDVTLIKRDDDKNLSDPLEHRTAFTLQATAKGRNLDKARNNVCGITWELGEGAEKYVTMGAATATATGSNCSFTMKSDFKIDNKDGTAPFEIRATSVRSVQIPYYTGSAKSPVVGVYRGTARVEQGDFKIMAVGSLQRGQHQPYVDYVGMVDDITNQIPGFNTSTHVLFAGCKVNELIYHQQENSPSNSFTYLRDVRGGPTVFKGEGVTLGITPPRINEASPNIAYEYEVTFYIFDLKNNGDNWGNMRVFQPGQVEVDGYNIADAIYKSNTVTFYCDRLFLYYENQYFATKADGSKDEKHWTGDMTATVKPRATGIQNWQQDWMFRVPLIDSDNIESHGVQNAFNGDSFKIYYKKNNSWVEFNDSRRIHQNSAQYSGLTNFLELNRNNYKLEIKYTDTRWTDDVPSVVRIVPDVAYTENGQSMRGVLFDNYVTVKLWNIEVPTVESYQTGIQKTDGPLKGKTVTRCYIPSPLDWEFDFVKNERGYQTWKHPYPANVAGYDQVIPYIDLSYRLSYNADVSGAKTWYLQLTHLRNGEHITIATYTCKESEDMWVPISGDQLPGNIRDDFDK